MSKDSSRPLSRIRTETILTHSMLNHNYQHFRFQKSNLLIPTKEWPYKVRSTVRSRYHKDRKTKNELFWSISFATFRNRQLLPPSSKATTMKNAQKVASQKHYDDFTTSSTAIVDTAALSDSLRNRYPNNKLPRPIGVLLRWHFWLTTAYRGLPIDWNAECFFHFRPMATPSTMRRTSWQPSTADGIWSILASNHSSRGRTCNLLAHIPTVGNTG